MRIRLRLQYLKAWWICMKTATKLVIFPPPLNEAKKSIDLRGCFIRLKNHNYLLYILDYFYNTNDTITVFALSTKSRHDNCSVAQACDTDYNLGVCIDMNEILEDSEITFRIISIYDIKEVYAGLLPEHSKSAYDTICDDVLAHHDHIFHKASKRLSFILFIKTKFFGFIPKRNTDTLKFDFTKKLL